MRGKQIIVKNADDLKKAKAPQDETMGTAKADKKAPKQKENKTKDSEESVPNGADFHKLSQENVKLKEKNEQLQDQYLRAEAEIANMNNHFKKERAELLKYSGQKLAQEILPGIDNLKRALAVKTDDKGSEQLRKGIEMILKQMNQALKDNEIIEISEAGVKFDPLIHQAVSVVEAQQNEKKNVVKQVLQSGYKLKDRVIRPAMVIVTK